MFVGSMQVELHLHGVLSLKEKRFALKSIKTKLRNQYNISIAEVDYHDKWQRSLLGIACVSKDKNFIDMTFAKVIKFIDNDHRVEIIDHLIEML